MHQRMKLLAAVLACTLADLPQARAQTSPSDQNPDAPLALHNLSRSGELLSRLTPLLEKASRDVQGIVASRGKATGRQLAEANVALRRLERGALDLQMHGETAGADYGVRVDRLKKQLQQALATFLGNPASGPQIAAIRQSLRNRQSNVDKAIKNVRNLAAGQKWDQAYSLLHETLDQVNSHTIFLSPQESDPFQHIYLLSQQVSTPRNKAYREQVQAALEKAGSASVPDTEGLLAAIAAASLSLQSSPTAQIDGQSRSGPECLDYFLRQWQEIQLSALRCRAIDWARGTAIPQLPYLPTPSLPNRVDEEQYAGFYQQFVTSLAGIIAADASRTTADDSPALYHQHLRVLGAVMSRAADDRLEAAIQQALDQLVAKSPALTAQVLAYRTATDELLRWRERLAAEAAAARAAQFPASASLLQQAFTSRDEYRGLLPENDPDLRSARLIGAAPEALAPAPEQLVGRSVRVDGVAGLPGDKLAVSVYSQRHYATLPRAALAEQITALSRDLLLADELPALSLPAAIAIGSAQQGDLRALGGTIESVHLEGLIARWATLPAAALAMTQLGPLPAETTVERLMLPQVQIRLQVTPAWVRHRYFFAETRPSE